MSDTFAFFQSEENKKERLKKNQVTLESQSKQELFLKFQSFNRSAKK